MKLISTMHIYTKINNKFAILNYKTYLKVCANFFEKLGHLHKLLVKFQFSFHSKQKRKIELGLRKQTTVCALICANFSS